MDRKQINLWNWLLAQETESKIECPPDLHISIEAFEAELKKQLEGKRLPVKVGIYQVNWTDIGIEKTRILVERIDGDSLLDIICYVIGIDYEGVFTFVAEKVYLKPPQLPELPDLPDPPREKKELWAKPDPSISIYLFVLGAFFVLVGILNLVGTLSIVNFLVFCLIGIAVLCGSFLTFRWYGAQSQEWQRHQHEIEKWNREVQQARKEAEAARDKTLTRWIETVAQIARLTKVDNTPGRFTQSVSSTVNQTIKDLFKGEGERTEKDRIRELEEELEKRKKEGFR